jgi:glutamine---fructose-6-phosphate transaminase (isomerizing)
MITREKAIELAERENEPRFETIRWYLEMIGLDFAASIKKINAIPKLY